MQDYLSPPRLPESLAEALRLARTWLNENPAHPRPIDSRDAAQL